MASSPLDPATTAKLQHPTSAEKPMAVMAFYPDGSVQPFTPDGISVNDVTLPAKGQDNIYFDYTTTAFQLTAVTSIDSIPNPTKTGTTMWFGSGSGYRCIFYST